MFCNTYKRYLRCVRLVWFEICFFRTRHRVLAKKMAWYSARPLTHNEGLYCALLARTLWAYWERKYLLLKILFERRNCAYSLCFVAVFQIRTLNFCQFMQVICRGAQNEHRKLIWEALYFFALRCGKVLWLMVSLFACCTVANACFCHREGKLICVSQLCTQNLQ